MTRDTSYVASAFETIEKGGDAYASMDRLFKACSRFRKGLSHPQFSADLARLVAAGIVQKEGQHLYTVKTWRLEEDAAEKLEQLQLLPPLPAAVLPEIVNFDGFTLFPEQRYAVATALSNRLSIILGGAGSGKTTLIRAIVNEFCNPQDCVVLCAPTGKAARHLGASTGLDAKTIHSTLGMRPGESSVEVDGWDSTQLLVVDEASMMTTEMLARILDNAPASCRIVLVGDRKQLLSVGPGNVLDDLLNLGIPVSRLKCNHRQAGNTGALLSNVVDFADLHSLQDLRFDDSFELVEAPQSKALDLLIKEAAARYLAGERIQVLASLRSVVKELNEQIRELVNPKTAGKLCIGPSISNDVEFRDGDRVIITQNDSNRDCCNGDVGVLHIGEDGEGKYYYVHLPDGREPVWFAGETASGLEHLELAYAMTVHKAQGSEYETVLFPVLESMQNISRNLFYTAISRAKKHVMLYGSKEAVDSAMRKELPPRNSQLVEKVQLLATRSA